MKTPMVAPTLADGRCRLAELDRERRDDERGDGGGVASSASMKTSTELGEGGAESESDMGVQDDG